MIKPGFSVYPFQSSLAQALLVCALLLGLALPIEADVVKDLYRVKQYVASQSADDLRRASREGLKEVLARVSGQQDVMRNRELSAALNKAQGMTRGYSYQRQLDSETGEERLQVVLDYEQQLVDNMLRAAGVPQWSANRPSLLVWLVVEDESGKHFVGADSKDSPMSQALQEQAFRKGLPLKLPLLDLEDTVALKADDVWRMRSEKIREASERYGAETILFGRASQLSNDRWIGSWRFLHNGAKRRLDGEATGSQAYAAQAFSSVASILASAYAIDPVQTTEGGFLMRVTQVRNFSDYARLTNYLESLTAVHHANVISMEGEELIVRLIADGQLAQLQQAIALDRRLRKASVSDYQGAYPIALDFEWPAY